MSSQSSEELEPRAQMVKRPSAELQPAASKKVKTSELAFTFDDYTIVDKTHPKYGSERYLYVTVPISELDDQTYGKSYTVKDRPDFSNLECPRVPFEHYIPSVHSKIDMDTTVSKLQVLAERSESVNLRLCFVDDHQFVSVKLYQALRAAELFLQRPLTEKYLIDTKHDEQEIVEWMKIQPSVRRGNTLSSKIFMETLDVDSKDFPSWSVMNFGSCW